MQPASPQKRKRSTDQERRSIAPDLTAGYRGGASLRELAMSIGRSPGWVRGVLSEAGVDIRPNGFPPVAHPSEPASVWTPARVQVADQLRHQIGTGVYAPGSRLPAERALAQRFRVGRDSVREALGVLEAEGVVVKDNGGASVAPRPVYTPVRVPPGASVTARMPSPDERHQLGIGSRLGVPVLVVRVPGGPAQLYPAHSVELILDSDQHRLPGRKR
jgi:hypothetical protein